MLFYDFFTAEGLCLWGNAINEEVVSNDVVGLRHGMGLWVLMILLMVIFGGGIIALVVWAITRMTSGGPSDRRSPLDIAKERYARGEITREQLEQIKKDL